MAEQLRTDLYNISNSDCAKMYQEFLCVEQNCETSVQSIIENFNALITTLKQQQSSNSQSNESSNIELIKNMVITHQICFKWKRLLHLNQKSIFINRYLKYRQNKENKLLSSQNNKILIIGCGPSGLRMAIELALYGCKNITLLDSRDYWSRKQIVAIWNITEADLISLGIRDLIPKFTKSNIKKSIPITYLQHFLLRIALLLGCNIRTNMYFKDIDFKNNVINVFNGNYNKLQGIKNDYDILIDATGTVGALRDCSVVNYHEMKHDIESVNGEHKSQSDDEQSAVEERKQIKSQISKSVIIGTKRASHLKKDVFGVVANFNRVKGDYKVEQILGKSYHFYRKEFDSKDIKLENIVYYRSVLTNYMAATVKKQSLISHNIFMNNKLKGKQLLHKSNICRNNLRSMILSVAKEWNIPHSKHNNPFNVLRKGNDDFAVFEFGKLKIAKQPIKFVKKYGQSDGEQQYQMIMCVGDSECAPFWPKGTGVNHAFIGVYLMVDIIKKWCNSGSKYNVEYLKEIEMDTKKDFDVLHGDLGDKQWHKTKIGDKYLPDYAVPRRTM